MAVRKIARHNILRLALILFALANSLFASTASANDAEEPAACNAQNSKAVDIEDVWRGERKLIGKCVAVGGYRAGSVIFNNQRDIYRHSSGRPASAKGLLGIPYPNQLSDDEGLMQGTYYGRIESCRDHRRSFRQTMNKRSQSKSEAIVLVHLYGYCATSTGPAIRIANADERPNSDLRRLTGDKLRHELGELIPVDDRFKYPVILKWLTALAMEPACDLGVAIDEIPPGGPSEDEQADFFGPTLDPPQASKLETWCKSDQRQLAIFEVSSRSPEFETQSKIDVIICACVEKDCAGRWPVSLIDTGWGVERPYFCQRAKFLPLTCSYDKKGQCEYDDYEYRFLNEHIVGSSIWQDWGFPD